jgi:hypothetical protein
LLQNIINLNIITFNRFLRNLERLSKSHNFVHLCLKIYFIEGVSTLALSSHILKFNSNSNGPRIAYLYLMCPEKQKVLPTPSLMVPKTDKHTFTGGSRYMR